MKEADCAKLLPVIGTVLSIIRETGFRSIGEFPMQYSAETKEDRALEASLERAQGGASTKNLQRLAADLEHYCSLDDINMGLMAAAAAFLCANGERFAVQKPQAKEQQK